MLKSVPVALVACRSAPKTPLVVVMCFISFVAFLMPVLRLVILCMVSGLFGFVRLSCGHVRKPSMGGGGLPHQMLCPVGLLRPPLL